MIRVNERSVWWRRSLRMADMLASQGYVVAPRFLTLRQGNLLATQSRNLWNRGYFQAARVGHGAQRRRAPAVRGDYLWWLSPHEGSHAQQHYLQRLDMVRQAVNRVCFAGLHDWEGHFAVYPPGSGYRKHIDRFQTNTRRTLSSVLYLNHDWSAEEGGALRLYLGEGGGEPTLDIWPEMGTLVLFLSAHVYHEVRPTLRERMSIAGWYRTAPVDGYESGG